MIMDSTKTNLNIFALNVNGLGDHIKRKTLFRKLRENDGIFLLQETHSTVDSEQIWKTQWGNEKLFFSHGSSKSRGVVIMFSSNIHFELLQVEKDRHGRFVIIDLKYNQEIYTVASIYAPTQNYETE